MKTPLLLFIAFGFLRSPASAQDAASDKAQTVEIGLNITTTLAGFFNSGGDAFQKDPYLFSLKLVKGNSAWRTGVNFRVRNSEEQLPDFNSRKIKENEFSFRIGKEWRKPVSKRFSLNYGLDAVGSWSLDKSESQFSFPSLFSKEEEFGIGAGPFLGVLFHLNERVSFATEAFAYGVFYTGSSKTDIGSGLPPEEREIREFRVEPAPPNSLYVFFSF